MITTYQNWLYKSPQMIGFTLLKLLPVIVWRWCNSVSNIWSIKAINSVNMQTDITHIRNCCKDKPYTTKYPPSRSSNQCFTSLSLVNSGWNGQQGWILYLFLIGQIWLTWPAGLKIVCISLWSILTDMANRTDNCIYFSLVNSGFAWPAMLTIVFISHWSIMSHSQQGWQL